MAQKILLTWELGAGMGHLIPLRHLAESLLQRGHRVALAAQDLTGAGRLFQGLSIEWWQAPFKNTRSATDVRPIRCFAHLLHNMGFGDPEELGATVQAWRNIFDACQPDAVVCDHSPTALLASHALPMRRFQIGTGFFCPPSADSLPIFDLQCDAEERRACERRCLDHASRALERHHSEPLSRLGQIYDTERALLITFAELDHYGARADGAYLGAWTHRGGVPPDWPDVPGKRVFAYLKPFQALPGVLEALARSGHRLLIHAPEVSDDLKSKWAGRNIRFESQPVDVDRVAESCDAAILNGNHATTAQLLLHGIPSIQIPLFMEQKLFTDRVVAMGAGLAVDRHQASNFDRMLDRMLNASEARACAARFAQAHAGHAPERAIAQAVDAIIA